MTWTTCFIEGKLYNKSHGKANIHFLDFFEIKETDEID